MQNALSHEGSGYYGAINGLNSGYLESSILLCNWQVLKKQLLEQWPMLMPSELAATGPNCLKLAALIAFKYGIAPSVVENYLRNFERTIPLL